MFKKIVVAFIVIVVVLEVIGLFILPEQIVMQINNQGEASLNINKYLGVGMLFILSVPYGISSLNSNKEPRKVYMFMIIILIIHFVVFFFN